MFFQDFHLREEICVSLSQQTAAWFIDTIFYMKLTIHIWIKSLQLFALIHVKIKFEILTSPAPPAREPA